MIAPQELRRAARERRLALDLVEKDYDLKRDEIPQRLGDFQLAIRKMLGPGGPII